jgi:hypothetical protein
VFWSPEAALSDEFALPESDLPEQPPKTVNNATENKTTGTEKIRRISTDSLLGIQRPITVI